MRSLPTGMEVLISPYLIINYLLDVTSRFKTFFSKKCTVVYSNNITPESMFFFNINIHITRFHTRFNNYRSCHRKFCKGHSVIQASFYAHSMLDRHCGIYDWQFFLIEKGCNKQETRKKSFFGNISLTHLYRVVSMSE